MLDILQTVCLWSLVSFATVFYVIDFLYDHKFRKIGNTVIWVLAMLLAIITAYIKYH